MFGRKGNISIRLLPHIQIVHIAYHPAYIAWYAIHSVLYFFRFWVHSTSQQGSIFQERCLTTYPGYSYVHNVYAVRVYFKCTFLYNSLRTCHTTRSTYNYTICFDFCFPSTGTYSVSQDRLRTSLYLHKPYVHIH